MHEDQRITYPTQTSSELPPVFSVAVVMKHFVSLIKLITNLVSGGCCGHCSLVPWKKRKPQKPRQQPPTLHTLRPEPRLGYLQHPPCALTSAAQPRSKKRPTIDHVTKVGYWRNHWPVIWLTNYWPTKCYWRKFWEVQFPSGKLPPVVAKKRYQGEREIERCAWQIGMKCCVFTIVLCSGMVERYAW